MKADKLKRVGIIAGETGSIFIATADKAGIPHIACAGKLAVEGNDYLAVTEWFCPGTIANLQKNKNVAVVVWDKDSDSGYQVLGRLEKIQDLGVLDGYAPDIEKKPPLPQVERKLVIKVEKILDFKLGPHADVEE